MEEQQQLEHPFIIKSDDEITHTLEKDIADRMESGTKYEEASIFAAMQGIVNALALA